MIKLYQFPTGFSLPNASPFCMKLETYLRMAKLPFEIVVIQDPRKAPKGKLPFIEDNGKKIADSQLIIEYLKKEYGDVVDAHLTPEQNAIATSLQRMLDEHLYWILMYSRWIEPKSWKIIKPLYFGHMPPVIRTIIPEQIRKGIIKTLHGQGLGRHARDEIYEIGKEDINAITNLLGTKAFLLGENPSSVDACAYAYLANFLKSPTSSPIQEHIKSQSSLIDYCTRMQARFYA